jgi:NADH-quinone oxidoreductase subunit H
MKFGWTMLIPISIVWIVIVAVARQLRNESAMSSTSILASGIAALIIVLLAIWLLQGAAERRARKEAEAEAERIRLEEEEQERLRINNQGGEEGLKYGALQIKPAEIIKPTDLIDHEYHLKS